MVVVFVGDFEDLGHAAVVGAGGDYKAWEGVVYAIFGFGKKTFIQFRIL